MAEIAIYHNPSCSKSREALRLIQATNHSIKIIEYLKYPPTIEEIKNLLTLLKTNVRTIIRDNEQEYKENNLQDDSLTDQQLITAISEFPKLLQRPLVIFKGKGIIARPAELVLTLID